MSKAPSTILSDALTSFNRAATLAFTAAQDQARKDVIHATADAREARRERDDAVNALHAARIEEQAWKEEASVWKAAANQAELTINHHIETIAQLRQEATQWKDQCLRLEETSRQEAISWKEQFLRVEQERSRLAQRVDGLVAEHLSSGGHVQAVVAPYTPMSKYSEFSASARIQRTSAVDSMSPGRRAHPPSKFAPSTSKLSLSANKARSGPPLQLPTPLSEVQRATRQRATQDVSQSENAPRQVVIRRVHAVVEVPVKEESVEPENVVPDTHSSAAVSNNPSTSGSAPKTVQATRTSKAPYRTADLSKATPRTKRKAAVKRPYVEIDESEQDDTSDVRQSNADSDGDDELLIGIEADRKEVYGMKHVQQPVAPKLKKRKVPPPSRTSRPMR